MDVSHIFRRYDIRGIYGKDLDEGIMRRIGNAFGRVTKTGSVVVARDMRLSSPSLKNTFVSGLLSAGKNVLDVGILPLGVGMFHAWKNGCEFAYISASHLPKEWNGVKFFHASGLGYLEDENKKMMDIFLSGEKHSEAGTISGYSTEKIIDDYVSHVLQKIAPEGKLSVAIDCGNGAAGVVAPMLFRRAGADVTSIYEDIDGTFPNRDPEPQTDSLDELRKNMKGKDIGIAYDGDGDRMVLMDEKGRKLTPEQAAYLILRALQDVPGGIVANVECTLSMDKLASRIGKEVIRCPVGHTFMVDYVDRHKACFGVEFAGHYVVPSIFPFDDSLAISLFAVCSLQKTGKKLSLIADEVPTFPVKRLSFECSDAEKFNVIEKMKKTLSSKYEKINKMDGVRVDFKDSWVLVRASNTAPIIRLTAEAETEKRLAEAIDEFSGLLQKEIGAK